MDSHADAVESEKFHPCKQQMIQETQNMRRIEMLESILTTILVKAEGGEIPQAATFNHYYKISASRTDKAVNLYSTVQ